MSRPRPGALLGTFAHKDIFAGTKFVIDAAAGRAYFITMFISGGTAALRVE